METNLSKTDENKLLIKEGMRRAFKKSKQFNSALEAAKVMIKNPPKKDGTPRAREFSYRYKCAHCHNLFPKNKVQVDHDVEIVPLDGNESDIQSYDLLAELIFCDLNNLQVLCSIPKNKNGGVYSCHTYKTLLNRHIRRKIRDMKVDGTFKGLTTELIDTLTNDFKLRLIEIELEKIRKAEKKKLKGKK